MPVEIREITIKTDITSVSENNEAQTKSAQDLATLKAQILEECKNELDENTKRVDIDR